MKDGCDRYGDVWEIKQEMHNLPPAPYPEELTDRIISSTNDSFGGSGTTAVSAIKNKRNYILIEKSKEYCDMAEKRIEGREWRETREDTQYYLW